MTFESCCPGVEALLLQEAAVQRAEATQAAFVESAWKEPELVEHLAHISGSGCGLAGSLRVALASTVVADCPFQEVLLVQLVDSEVGLAQYGLRLAALRC